MEGGIGSKDQLKSKLNKIMALVAVFGFILGLVLTYIYYKTFNAI